MLQKILGLNKPESLLVASIFLFAGSERHFPKLASKTVNALATLQLLGSRCAYELAIEELLETIEVNEI